MKPYPSEALHIWKDREPPGPKKRFKYRFREIRISEDHLSMLQALECEFGITRAEVWRKGLELLYERTYNEQGFNRNKLFDGYADV